jgi:hypothetical protein
MRSASPDELWSAALGSVRGLLISFSRVNVFGRRPTSKIDLSRMVASRQSAIGPGDQGKAKPVQQTYLALKFRDVDRQRMMLGFGGRGPDVAIKQDGGGPIS